MEENLRPQRSFSPPPIRRIADPAPPRFSMQGFLAPEVAEGLVTVQEMDDKTIVKEMSEEVIVKSLKKAVEAWANARAVTGF